MAQERSVILDGHEIPSLCLVGDELLLVELNAGQADARAASSAVWDPQPPSRRLGRVQRETVPLMTSVCTGALVHAAAGLLRERPATTHWAATDELRGLDRQVRRGIHTTPSHPSEKEDVMRCIRGSALLGWVRRRRLHRYTDPDPGRRPRTAANGRESCTPRRGRRPGGVRPCRSTVTTPRLRIAVTSPPT